MIEGAVTACVGIASWFLVPASICQTQGWLRGKNGWFNEREETILVNRILRDDPSKGDMNNRQAITWDRLWKCLKDYDLWPLYLVGLTTYIPPQPPQNYLSFILRQMGFSTFQANLLTIPSQFMFGVFVSLPRIYSLRRASTNLRSYSSSPTSPKDSTNALWSPACQTCGSFPGWPPSSPSEATHPTGSATPS